MSSLTLYKSKVYCVVITFNGSKWVHQCLLSLNKSRYPLSIIVVDNDSQDDTVEIIQKNFPDIALISSCKNLGFGQANNLGISKAIHGGADFVFLLNQDAWINEDTIEKLITAFTTNTQFGILSPLHYTASGLKLDAAFYSYLQRDYQKKEIQSLIDSGDSNIRNVSFVNAAAWMLSRHCIKKVGGFNPLFFLYGEDNDYINRLKYNGLKLGFLSDCKIFHDRESRDEATGFNSLRKMVTYYQIKMMTRFTDVNRPFVITLLFSWGWVTKEIGYQVIFKNKLFAIPAYVRIVWYSFSIITSVWKNRNKIKTRNSFLFLTPDPTC